MVQPIFNSDFFKKKEKYINELSYKLKIAIKGYWKINSMRDRIMLLLTYLSEICFTGICVWVALGYSNWFTYGLRIALLTYYTEWFVSLVKKREENIN